jgi:hypothetical protein
MVISFIERCYLIKFHNMNVIIESVKRSMGNRIITNQIFLT